MHKKTRERQTRMDSKDERVSGHDSHKVPMPIAELVRYEKLIRRKDFVSSTIFVLTFLSVKLGMRENHSNKNIHTSRGPANAILFYFSYPGRPNKLNSYLLIILSASQFRGTIFASETVLFYSFK